MSNFRFMFLGILMLSILISSSAIGGGYQLNEQGARAVGMGGAFAANASDPSAVYYNPAGLAFQKGINLLAGVNIIIPSTTWKAPAPSITEVKTNSQVFTPVNIYTSYQYNDRIVFGFGVYNPFCLGTEWPDPFNSKTDLQTWYINPSVGYLINDQLSLGLGISYVHGSISFTNTSMSYEGTGNSFNINGGIIYRPHEDLSIGMSYRTPTYIEFSGDLKVPSSANPVTGKGELPMPGNLYVGIAYNLSPELTIEGDIQYIQWSSYEKLEVKTPAAAMSLGQRDWVDNITLRGGAEYKLDQQATIRGGLILDLSPQPPSKTETMLPDGDRVDISFGGSYKIDNNLSVDASYMLVLFMERDAKKAVYPFGPAGTFNSTAHILSVNIGYSF